MIKFKTRSGDWTLGDCTIQKYYLIQEWLTLSDQKDPQIRMISILSGAPEEEIREISGPDFERLWSKAAFGPLSALTDTRFQNEIEVDGQRFHFINLRALSIGELADMDTLKAHPQVDKQLHKMMAILYRPMGTNGKIIPHTSEGFEERAQFFLEKMSVAPIVAAIDFFFHITKASLSNMMDSLESMMQEIPEMLTPHQMSDLTKKLQEDGVDSSMFLPGTTSLKRTSAKD
jgi:hypothetical protein